MGHIATSQDLPVASDRVWATILDTSTWGDWLTIHAGWLEEPPATVTKGSKLVEKVFMLGMANKIEWVVDEVDDGRNFKISGTGMAGVKANIMFTLEPNGDSTKVTIDADFSGSIVVGALAKAVEKDAHKNLAESLDKLVVVAGA